MENPVALFDMDNTLVDFSAGLAREMSKLEAPSEKWDYKNYDQDSEPLYMRDRRRLVKSKPGFWSGLPIYRPGYQLLDLAHEIGFRIVIFTKLPTHEPIAAKEKIEWCHEHLSHIPHDISLVSDKGLHYGKLLVDDWPPYVSSWLSHRPRGHVIMPYHLYNASFGVSTPQVVHYRDSMISISGDPKGINPHAFLSDIFRAATMEK